MSRKDLVEQIVLLVLAAACGYMVSIFMGKANDLPEDKDVVFKKLGELNNQKNHFKTEIFEIKSRKVLCVLPVQTYLGVGGRKGGSTAPTLECVKR